MIEAGTFLQNRYRVSKQIGQGGMGAVYLATDERFNSTVAVKETLFADVNYCKAFEREARLLNSLRHPALPTVSDHFVEGNGQFIVMEYIAGEDLAEQLAKNGKPFPVAEVLVWANQLLDALEFLHNQEMPVIHRDIKPQNLKLTRRNQIILLDFGLAKGNPTDVSHQTAAKSIFGYSPGYASLEQIQGTGTEPRSDLYSLAATLYHLLTGIPPTDALTRAMRVLNEQDDPLPPANSINHKIPAGLAEVLKQAMALNANHRPASAAIMRGLLEESDKTENIGDFVTASDKALPTSIYTQNTRLFSDRKPPQSEIKTEILSRDANSFNDSSETRLINEDTRRTIFGAKNKYKIGAAVLGVLLIFGFGILALVNDAQDPSPVENNFHETKFSSVDEKNTEINPDVDNENHNADTPLNSTATDSTIKKDMKPSEVAAAPAKSATKQTKPQTETSEEPIVIQDEEEGNVKIYDNKIETDEAIIESNRIILKKPGQRTATVIPINPEEMRRMTPQQRRKLLRLRNMQKQFPHPPKPQHPQLPPQPMQTEPTPEN